MFLRVSGSVFVVGVGLGKESSSKGGVLRSGRTGGKGRETVCTDTSPTPLPDASGVTFLSVPCGPLFGLHYRLYPYLPFSVPLLLGACPRLYGVCVGVRTCVYVHTFSVTCPCRSRVNTILRSKARLPFNVCPS